MAADKDGHTPSVSTSIATPKMTGARWPSSNGNAPLFNLNKGLLAMSEFLEVFVPKTGRIASRSLIVLPATPLG